MLLLACVVGFMGPFGTFSDGGLVERITHWWQLLMGAFLLVRPAIYGLGKLAQITELPPSATVFWGVVVVSVPLAVLWRNVGQDEFRELDGYAGLIPFSLLCSLAVLAVFQWAANADRRIVERRRQSIQAKRDTHGEETSDGTSEQTTPPALTGRLSSGFRGPVLALQSEDHYVRVHGAKESELLLIRLRDAIREMGDVHGEQVHRSWWVAHDSIAGAESSGRSWTIMLKNGLAVPVARDSVSRLQAAGLLPERATNG